MNITVLVIFCIFWAILCTCIGTLVVMRYIMIRERNEHANQGKQSLDERMFEYIMSQQDQEQ